jgi:PEP-CTERM motif
MGSGQGQGRETWSRLAAEGAFAMRLRRIGFSLLGLVAGFWAGQLPTGADVISEESGFGFVQTDFAPGINVGADNPLTFTKFNPGSAGIPANAVLDSVQLSFNWGFRSQLSASFPFPSDPPSSIMINSFGNITLGRPDITITSPSNDPSLFQFPTQTFQNTASFSSSTPGTFPTAPPLSTYFHALPPGYVVPPSDQPEQLVNPGDPLMANITPGSSDFAKFVGPGTVTFDVVATAGFNIPNTSGNATGTALSYAFPDMVLTYVYTIPEPSSLALLGLGVGGWLLARRHRRWMAAR